MFVYTSNFLRHAQGTPTLDSEMGWTGMFYFMRVLSCQRLIMHSSKQCRLLYMAIIYPCRFCSSQGRSFPNIRNTKPWPWQERVQSETIQLSHTYNYFNEILFKGRHPKVCNYNSFIHFFVSGKI